MIYIDSEETMRFVKKLVKYSTDEIDVAHKYIRLARECSDVQLVAKLHDMTVVEMQHCDFDQQTAMKMINTMDDAKSKMVDIWHEINAL